MSDTAYQIDLPAEVLSANECSDATRPSSSRFLQIQAATNFPWYERRLRRHAHSSPAVWVKIGGEYLEASPTERRIIWMIEGLVCSPVILVALLFRGGDRLLRIVHVLQPLSAKQPRTPVDVAVDGLWMAAIRCEKVYADSSGQLLLGQEKRKGPCIDLAVLPSIRHQLASRGAETELNSTKSELGVGRWSVSFTDARDGSFTLSAARLPDRA
jgi:hypothetical protein